MIANDRQYRITRSEAKKFKEALANLAAFQAERKGVHPRLLQAEREALESQHENLLLELQEYEALKLSEAPVLEIDELSRLGEGLIKARIASGLTQKQLAEKIGIKPQQIQRYEMERYESATLKRLSEVVDALGVRISNDILVPYQAADLVGLEKKVAQVGIDEKFFLSRILSSKHASTRDDLIGDRGDLIADRGSLIADNTLEIKALCSHTAEILERIYGWTTDQLFGSDPLTPPGLAAATARFKMPAGRKEQETTAYVAYAHYLSMIIVNSMPRTNWIEIPNEPKEMREAICDAYGQLDLTSALNYAWDLGVPVLPLSDGKNFHGACWRYQYRNVIVLKQRSPHVARWLFDLLHELYHAAQHKEKPTFELIEASETSTDRRESEEEVMASQFAGEVVLKGNAEGLAKLCVDRANNRVDRLKNVVPTVAKEAGVEVGALANYLAFRLSRQAHSWWGVAAKLQKIDDDPWLIAREVFFKRFNFNITDNVDRGLLKRALEGNF